MQRGEIHPECRLQSGEDVPPSSLEIGPGENSSVIEGIMKADLKFQWPVMLFRYLSQGWWPDRDS